MSTSRRYTAWLRQPGHVEQLVLTLHDDSRATLKRSSYHNDWGERSELSLIYEGVARYDACADPTTGPSTHALTFTPHRCARHWRASDHELGTSDESLQAQPIDLEPVRLEADGPDRLRLSAAPWGWPATADHDHDHDHAAGSPQTLTLDAALAPHPGVFYGDRGTKPR